MALFIGLSGCGGNTPPPASTTTTYPSVEPERTTSPPPPAEHSHGVDHSGVTVDGAQRGDSESAVRSVAENFVVGYGEFSPFVFDPAEEWFDRWDTYASAPFIGQAQVNLNRLWGWTWRQQVKALDVQIRGEPDVALSGDTARVVVRANRLVLGINDTADKAREQNLTYTLTMTLRGPGNFALVTQTAEAPTDR
jgi:hypothetical protein